MEEKIVVKKLPKSPTLAGVIAFFFPFGVGALYNGLILKGIIYIFIFSGLVSMLSSGYGSPVFLGLLLGGFYFYQLIEAVQDSKRLNQRFLKGEEKEEEKIEQFPEAVKSGSIFWGIFLLALGGILLFANFDVISYETIFDLWPLAVIVIGVKLIIDYYGKQKQKS